MSCPSRANRSPSISGKLPEPTRQIVIETFGDEVHEVHLKISLRVPSAVAMKILDALKAEKLA